ncbi:MAG: sulfite exporter TauE/SafE family protein [Jatrophihabitantaceae bacterium]
MTIVEPAALLLAGLAAGLIGGIAGLASIISYPALLATGLSPVSANVTNTTALVFSGAGAALGSRPELRGQRHRARVLGVAGLCGGLLGAALLLRTPPDTFAKLVPWLIGLSSLAILLPRPRAHPVGPARDRRWVVGSVFAIAVYGGYFGAAAGVMLLALLLATTAETLPQSNAMKNLVLFGANLVAAAIFSIGGAVHWLAVLPLATGFFLGGTLAPRAVRRMPAGPLRLLIAIAGTAIAIKLGLQAY